MELDLPGALDAHVWALRHSRVDRVRSRPVPTVSASLVNAVLRRIGRPMVVPTRTFWGDRMQVVLPEPVSNHLFRFGFYEENLTRFLLARLKPGRTFVDIGAHLGYYTLLASTLVGPSGTVHAFEPTPTTFGLLERNVGGRPGVTLLQRALWSIESEVTMTDFGLGLSAYNSVFRPRMSSDEARRADERRFTATAVSLDEHVAATGIVPDVVKIDAESAEFHVLAGAAETFRQARPDVALEVGDLDLEGVPPSRALVDAMVEQGYRPYEVVDGLVRPHEVRERYAYDNLLFIATEKEVM